MPDINFSKLKDNTSDVDPDVRFMALEDFKKVLSHNDKAISSHSIESFIPTLFKLLKDQNADVQSQAVKSFEPCIKYLKNDVILDIIKKLFDLIIDDIAKNKNISNFTTSIPNMALRSLLQSDHKFLKRLSRSIIDILVPQVLSQQITIDLIEILIDIIDSLGYSLCIDEFYVLGVKLIEISFNETGIIAKRAVVGLDHLLSNLVNSELSGQLLDKLILNINDNFNSLNGSPNYIGTKLSLYSSVLNNYRRIKGSRSIITLHSSSIDIIFTDIKSELDVTQMSEDFEADDLDYDNLILLNLRRETALNTLNDMIMSVPYNQISQYLDNIIDIIKACIQFDPLNLDNSDDLSDSFDQNSDDESDIEFSDDDDENDNGEENDGSWKVRIKANILIKSLVKSYPETLPKVYSSIMERLLKSLNDRNDFVSNESINTMIAVINATSLRLSRKRRGSGASMTTESEPSTILINEVAPELEAQIFQTLLVKSKIDRFNHLIKLVESLISKVGDGLSSEFLSNLYSKVVDLELKTSGSMEYLILYNCILTNFEISEIPSGLVNYIINEITISLSNKTTFFNILSESINMSILLFRKLRVITHVDEFYYGLDLLLDSLIEKSDNKQYSSELRQQSLVGLNEFVLNIEVKSHDTLFRILHIFEKSFKLEATVKLSLQCLYSTLSCSKNKAVIFSCQGFMKNLIEATNQFLLSNDDTLSLVSLRLLDIISENYQSSNLEESCQTLIKSLSKENSSNSFKHIQLSFEILSRSINSSFITEETMLVIADKLVNSNFGESNDLDISIVDKLIKRICNENKSMDLFHFFINNLNLNLFISARILSIITIEYGLLNEVEKCEKEVTTYLDSKGFSEHLLFNIQFLGNIGSKSKLQRLDYETFLVFLNENDETIKMAASRSLGLFILSDLEITLPIFIRDLKKNDDIRQYMLLALREIISFQSADNGQLKYIWDELWGCICSDDELKTSELKISGDVLSRIVIINGEFAEDVCKKIQNVDEKSLSTIYTTIVILKHLINNYSDQNDIPLTRLLYECLPYLRIMKVEVKEALIGTLLTALHNKPNILLPILNDKVLPVVFEELLSKQEFKKVIPMGPYKYVVDDGLEVRKLSYELLYAIISLDMKAIKKYDLNMDSIGEAIITKGLVDEESDIIILSTINLVNLLKNDKSDLLITNTDCLGLLIKNLTTNLSKKLKAKASAQETETYQETIKSVLKLTSQANSFLEEKNYHYNEWSLFYQDVRSNFSQIQEPQSAY